MSACLRGFIKKSALIAAPLWFLWFLAGCQVLESYFPSPTPWNTLPPYRTRTPAATPTLSATPSPTSLPSPTLTPLTPARPGTPLPRQPQPLTPANAAHLALLARWGRGFPRQLAWESEGKRLAVASTRGLYLYSAETLQLLQQLEPGPPLRSAAFASQGGWLAAGAEDGRIFLWDAQSQLHILSGHASPVLSLAFSPQGDLLASGAWDGHIDLWNLPAGQLRQVIQAHPDGVRRLAFSADGKTLFSWARRDQVQAWPMFPGGLRKTFYVGLDGLGFSGTSAAFSLDGSVLAIDQDYRVRLFRTADGTSLSLLTRFRSPVQDLALAADGSALVTLDDSSLKLWRSQGGQPLGDFPSPLPSPRPRLVLLAYSPDGKKLALLSEDWKLIALDPAGDQPASLPADFQSEYRLASFPAQGQTMIDALLDGRLVLHDLATGQQQPLARLERPPAEVSALGSPALSPDRTLAAFSGAGGQVWVMRLASGQVLFRLKDCRRLVNDLAFSPDGRWLAATCAEQKLRIWDLQSGKPAAALDAPGASRLSFTPEGSLLAVQQGSEVHFWRVGDWQAVDARPGRAFAFAPIGHLVALATDRQGQPWVRLQSIGSDVWLAELPVEANQMAFSPDGTLLAVLGRQLTLWQVAEGRLLARFENPGSYSQVFFSADGRLLVLSAGDGATAVYGVP